MMFRFYGIAFYFFKYVILVIAIVIICFIFFGKVRREQYQQKRGFKRNLTDRDHTKTLFLIQRMQ
ncbi:hypothetical protein APT61_04285 [Leclercia adecarboxylata]|nr:hypothetical protein APT61_04285 [Leclercia adecarboxylata]OOB86474.1 hypothetical protein BZY71_13675 [Leclercia adecarboxylata]QBF86309.1 hypothetical protein EXN74_07235 [Leclercia adecarboxylata]HAG02697.1 hypothetical protein [Leclercia adecarboxylata]